MLTKRSQAISKMETSSNAVGTTTRHNDGRYSHRDDISLLGAARAHCKHKNRNSTSWGRHSPLNGQFLIRHRRKYIYEAGQSWENITDHTGKRGVANITTTRQLQLLRADEPPLITRTACDHCKHAQHVIRSHDGFGASQY